MARVYIIKPNSVELTNEKRFNSLVEVNERKYFLKPTRPPLLEIWQAPPLVVVVLVCLANQEDLRASLVRRD